MRVDSTKIESKEGCILDNTTLFALVISEI